MLNYPYDVRVNSDERSESVFSRTPYGVLHFSKLFGFSRKVHLGGSYER